jgi:alkylated DNA repair dioxygenase AlkB
MSILGKRGNENGEQSGKRHEGQGKEIPFQTSKSALVLYDINPHIMEVIRNCVATIDDELEVQPEILIFGKVARQRRNVGFYSDTSIGYRYSNRVMASKRMHQCLIELLNYVNEKFNYNYNGILINKYIGGEDYISPHSDDERGLDQQIGVISISYGVSRKFRVRHKDTKRIAYDLPTDSSKIMQMAGDFQKEFTHEIVKEPEITGTRFSFTFRHHLT